MLFSATKWNDSQEVQAYIQSSSALSFERCQSALQHAEDIYIRPVIGDKMLASVQSYYESTSATDKQKQLLSYLQGAEANLAFYIDFDEFQIRLTDQGIQRQETEKFKQAYRYQEHNMRQLYLNRGLNYLERAIDYMDANSGDFTDWSSSDYYKSRNTLIVRSPKEISELHFINNSHIIYMRLLPSIRIITDINLPKVIGKKLHADFMKALADGSTYIKDNLTALSTEDFRKSCVKYVVFMALAKLIRETGSITDRGLYFGSVNATTPNPDAETPASASQIARLASSFDDYAYKFSTSLQDIVSNCFPDYFDGHECDVYQRDNRDKKMVWL